VGARLKLGPRDGAAPWISVVGIVGDMRRAGLEAEPIPQLFVPLAQAPSGLETLLVRVAAGDPLRMAPAVREALRRVDGRAPLYGITTLEARLGADLEQRRVQTSLLVGFSMAALLLAAIGISGLILYSVAARTQEIGIRMALGAQSRDIVRMIVREGLELSVAGLVLGLLGALVTARAGSSLLFGVTATDPLTFAAVAVLLTAVATAACYLPARRAMKVEPTVALRRGVS
jgi:putative ABC transport system permease protein